MSDPAQSPPPESEESAAPAEGAGTEPEADVHQPAIPAELAILALKDTIVFPGLSSPLIVGRPVSRRLIETVARESRIVGLVMQKDSQVEEPRPEDLHSIGTAAQILKLLKFPDGNLRVLVRGMTRIQVQKFTATDPFLRARVEVLHDVARPGPEIGALVQHVMSLLQKIFRLMPIVPEEVSVMLMNVEDPGRLADAVAALLVKESERKQEVLQTLDVRKRLESIVRLLSTEIEALEIGSKIQKEVQDEMGKTQRDYILRQQLKAIQKELGEEDESAALTREIEAKIESAHMPEEARNEALRELARLKSIPPASAEHSVARTYLEWMVALPWDVSTEDKIEVAEARRVLDEDHFDLDRVKDRMLEFLAVRKLRQDMRGPILCFAGPPGTGKTSLGRSIARAMGRRFYRLSLGGVRDEAEIRGHRRTYVGALPGRVIQSLRKAGTRNPVIMLDEIDKLGADFRGDPSSALLEVLDPEQNHSFTDHYLGVPFDLSRVLFIATANVLDTVPGPLRDRMEILRLSGYILPEKLEIARRYLVPRQLHEHGLTEAHLVLPERTVAAMIEGYTREAGVRSLERCIAQVARKVARRLAEDGKKAGRTTVRPADLATYLGPVQFESEMIERTSQPGVAIGLAWTPSGGDILFTESTSMPGAGTLTLTGQLGRVMRESARTALSLVRSRAADLGLTPDAFRRRDIHVHVPAGAIPKDGPSAGVTMATSLASLFTGRAVRPDLAMTGEITLRGRVMPVGGIKEKVLAAHRAGVRTVVLPARNRKDLEDIPAPVRAQIDFEFADSIEQIWKAALRLAPRRRKSAARASKASRPAIPKRPAARRSARRRGDPAAALSYSSRRSPS